MSEESRPSSRNDLRAATERAYALIGLTAPPLAWFDLLRVEGNRYRQQREAARAAEEADRRAWIQGLKLRLGIRTVDDFPRCLIQQRGCPTHREMSLLSHAAALNGAFQHVSYIVQAKAKDGMVPAEDVLRAINEPYRFPLADSDAAALAAYRKVYRLGDNAVLHLASCGRCNPFEPDLVLCTEYYFAVQEDRWEVLWRKEQAEREEHMQRALAKAHLLEVASRADEIAESFRTLHP
jgi:hypothetical protein